MKFYQFVILLNLFPLTHYAYAAESNSKTLQLKSSHVEYLAEHTMHNTRGVSNQAKGKGQCTQNECEFLVGIAVKSFDSGNGNRDGHMWTISKAAEFPILSMRLKTPSDLNNLKASDLKPEVNFAGKDGSLVVDEIKVSRQDKQIEIQTKAHFSLKEFSIEAPSLLGISVSDKIYIQAKTTWQ